MAELRQNLITRDWVVIATERAKRPEAFVVERPHVQDPVAHSPQCPLCPGNEPNMGEEVWRVPAEGPWTVRLVRNKFPAMTPEGMPQRKLSGIHRSMHAVGYHEVLVESPVHNRQPSAMSAEEMTGVLGACKRRYGELKSDPRVESIVLFRNHGYGAGTSQPHPHSQIIGMPVVSAQMRSRMEIAVRYFDEAGECIFCRTIKDERVSGERLIVSSRHFIAFVPFAALTPFHTWIYPLRHMSSFDQMTDEEVADLSGILLTLLRKMHQGLNDPDYNLIVRSIPTHLIHTDYFHWYISIVPRLSIQAGFELGSGMYINTSIPEESAAFLREVKTEG